MEGRIGLAQLVVTAGCATSTSEARRLIRQNAVRLDGATLSDPNARVLIRDGMVLNVGKRRWGRLEIV